MSHRRHYAHAPVVEAVIDLHAQLPDGTTAERIASVHEPLRAEFPQRQERRLRQVQMEFAQDFKSSQRESLSGYLFLDPSGTRVVQSRVDGFAFTRLAPYDNWETLSADARRLWDIYRRAANPIRVYRAAVRYINNISLALPVTEIRDYLPLVPDLPTGVPQELDGVFLQLRLKSREPEASVIINHGIVPPSSAGCVSFVLDIDVFSVRDRSPEGSALWKDVEDLHLLASRIFESSITDKVREVIA